MRERFKELAQSYLPWWRTDEKNKDAGLRLAEIFLMQMEENKREFNQLMGKIHVSFTELAGLSLKPPKPSCGVVIMKIIDNEPEGVWIDEGTKLYGSTADGDKIVFETLRGLYATGSRVKNIFAEIGAKGKIRPVFGEFPTPFPIGNEEPQEIYTREEAVIYHPYLFRGDNQVYVIKTENERLIRAVEKHIAGIYYFSERGLLPAENLRVLRGRILFEMREKKERDDAIVIKRNPVSKSNIAEKLHNNITMAHDNIAIAHDNIVTSQNNITIAQNNITKNNSEKSNMNMTGETTYIGNIFLASAAPKLKADFVKNHVMDCDTEGFYPFGETFGEYEECIISQDICFSKANALIVMEFSLKYDRFPVGFEPKEEQKLPIIKKYKKYEQKQIIHEVKVDKAAFEYNSKNGWKRLSVENQENNGEDIFSAEKEGNIQIKFYCPKDWGNEEVERLLRIRIISSKHCYEQPCIFNAPYISNMQISYDYSEIWQPPSKIVSACGIDVKVYSDLQNNKENIVLFHNEKAAHEEIYVCLDKKIMKGPVSLYIQCGNEPANIEEMEYFYYTKNGFVRLMTDTDKGRSQQKGILIFDAAQEMESYNYCGVEGYYIKIVHNNDSYFGKAWSVMPNAIEVWNVDTGMEEDYYIEETASGMTVKLYGSDILKADLWVDETRLYLDELKAHETIAQHDVFAQHEMFVRNEAPVQQEAIVRNKALSQYEALVRENRVRIEKNENGETEKVLVLWQETGSFEESIDKRAYMLDRESGSVIFGDGINQMLPTETEQPAFKAIIYKCSGEKGNVERGAISEAVSNIMFLDSLYNTEPSYGGCDRETAEKKQRRGEILIGSHKRLVTAEDYYRECMNFSDIISQVKIKLEKGSLYIAVLTKDFNENKGSFERISAELKNHLINMSEAAAYGNINIVKPVTVEISSDLWLRKNENTDMLLAEQRFKEIMDSYLHNENGNGKKGWKLGELPNISGILMQLGALRQWGAAQKLSVTARYTHNGKLRECELDRVETEFAMTVKSGSHEIHVLKS